MNLPLSKLPISIWGLALCYFAFYVPYSAMTKALSRGFLPGTSGPISGFEMLPAVVTGTFFGLMVILGIMGWPKYAGCQNLLGIRIPFATNRWTFYSGIATAFIIMTTTLAYSFTGISIVFAALLMRGGVLLIAPVMDIVFKRKIHWYSGVALGLSLLALALIFSEKGGYELSLIAALNIVLYLSGYLFRLRFMTHIAKATDKEANYRFFIEEMVVAMYAIIAIPAVLALIGYGAICQDLRQGFTGFLSTAMTIPALVIGLLYACLYIFGTRIYLNSRENTFCIPINRCSSLLAGVAASFLLTVVIGGSFVSSIQLLSSVILIVAILFLSYPAFQRQVGWGKKVVAPRLKKVYLFVCPGNTGRSPMAQAICQDRIVKILLGKNLDLHRAGIEIISAGIDPEAGKPMSSEAKKALAELGIQAPVHYSRRLTAGHIRRASKVFCMSEAHRKVVIGKFPEATFKAYCIDPKDRLSSPHGNGLAAYIEFGKEIQQLIIQAIETRQISIY